LILFVFIGTHSISSSCHVISVRLWALYTRNISVKLTYTERKAVKMRRKYQSDETYKGQKCKGSSILRLQVPNGPGFLRNSINMF